MFMRQILLSPFLEHLWFIEPSLTKLFSNRYSATITILSGNVRMEGIINGLLIAFASNPVLLPERVVDKAASICRPV